MYIADTSVREPSGSTRYTRLSGWSGSSAHVVVDPVPLDVVLVAGRTVADRVEAGGLGDGGVGPLREVAERRRHEVLGERLLLGGDAGRARTGRSARSGSNGTGAGAGRCRRTVERRRRPPSASPSWLWPSSWAHWSVRVPSAAAAWPAPWPSRAANGPHSWGAIHTWTIGLSPPACTVPSGQLPSASVTPATCGPFVAAAPAEVLVDVPLHQPAAVVDELGVVDRALADDEHRRHERALIAVDPEHQRLRLRRVEDDVVVDQRVVDEVLVAGAGVADRAVAELVERVDVGERRQLLQRVPDEGGRPQLLLGGDAVDAAEVDRLRRVERPRPVRRGRGGRRAGACRGGVVLVAVGVAVGGSTGAPAPEATAPRRHGCASGRCRRASPPA